MIQHQTGIEHDHLRGKNKLDAPIFAPYHRSKTFDPWICDFIFLYLCEDNLNLIAQSWCTPEYPYLHHCCSMQSCWCKDHTTRKWIW